MKLSSKIWLSLHYLIHFIGVHFAVLIIFLIGGFTLGFAYTERFAKESYTAEQIEVLQYFMLSGGLVMLVATIYIASYFFSFIYLFKTIREYRIFSLLMIGLPNFILLGAITTVAVVLIFLNYLRL